MLETLIRAILLASIVAVSTCAELVPIKREIVVDSGDGTTIIYKDGQWVEVE